MTAEFGLLSLAPPVLAIALAIWKKRVLPALFAGIFSAQLVLHGDSILAAPFAMLDHMVGVATDPGNFRLILFSFLIGGLLKLIKEANGFEAFAAKIERHRIRINKRSAFGTTWFLGVSLFLEGWSNFLINGTTVAPLYDRLGLSRERMAYFVHTIGIAVVSMVPINSWAAFYMGLLMAQGVEEPFGFLLRAIPYMLYSWISLFLILYVMLTGMTIGPMRRFDKAAAALLKRDEKRDAEAGRKAGRIEYMAVPVITLVVTVLASLYVTGGGEITRGDGSKSVLYAVAVSLAVTSLVLLARREYGFLEIEDRILAGMSEFFPVGILIVFALSLGDLTQQLGTGLFITGFVGDFLPQGTLPALVFLLGAGMSFATGTSYGTFSIMVPIALPLAAASGISPELMFGAVIAGGLFGDNCSPISDSTIVTCIGAEVKIIDHVTTQLPYALVSAGITAVAFLLLGAFN
ncbi:MAG: hypothetical protein F4Z95_11710 [Gammaproteobacteria bacterium]|nr:hypothetical protein [Gammaproteobacteria bacterium]MXW21461.1 hypothetical protein [Gammaproteobacteria bacterium]MYH35152.1 hypothetical protein [Gammaproteobacteria bacterium]MYL01021.1 hypothetical protein [Gammaproteobacteria bacterium]